ncbi:DUF2695 domain-containing protein [Blastococcus sp. TML/M2B]|uniref:DUF2695 domain-containing protein n=1 Tax=unclassified Blastococcus TaxID=2619396 RepID=UPI00190BAE89|nr:MULTISPECIES: DUF2695 domain-containing protein [unclassified Blastococcus]MBN1093298.1 DUF2695 domain-containing protein [Blastococcus sp. TML/M2B]MBN1096589.1 DUF2695 domain-containing protein [Blastococcus sp. TML/C7B]
MASKDQKAHQKQLKDEYLRAQQAASASRMPLDAEQLQQLLEHVDAAVLAAGCDHGLRATEAWAHAHRIDVERLREGLEEYGGFCDCEVVMNVYVEDVFTARRQQAPGTRR